MCLAAQCLAEKIKTKKTPAVHSDLPGPFSVFNFFKKDGRFGIDGTSSSVLLEQDWKLSCTDPDGLPTDLEFSFD